MLAHELPPVADHRGEALAQAAELLALAAVQRHALAVLAQAHQRKAEIGLEALLVEVEADQRPADEVGEDGADDRVDQRDPDQVARESSTPAEL